MREFIILAIRLVLGIVFAIILMRIFYPQAGIMWTAVAALALVCLAYITESLRKRKNNP